MAVKEFEEELQRRQILTDEQLRARQEAIARAKAASISATGAERGAFYGSSLSPAMAEAERLTGSRLGPAKAAVTSDLSRELSGKVDRNLRARVFASQRDKINLEIENAVRRASEAGLSKEQAMTYGKQVGSNIIRRQNQMEQAALERESGGAIAEMGYGAQPVLSQLQNKYAYNPSLAGAVTRALFGLGASATTAALLSKKRQGVTIQTPIPTPKPATYSESKYS